MITFSAQWLKYGFEFLLAILLLIGALQVMNALRHGAQMRLITMTTGIFIAGVAVIVWLTLTTLGYVDWTSAFSVAAPSLGFFHF